MNIATGTRLGAYEIVEPIGAGGMGEVYRARDTRLDRSVAIKILPAEFAENAALKLRFEREAKTISALSHPHICALYDVGETDSRAYLVMEYLEGESLAERLTKGPLPIDQLLRTGVEIASALDSAHRQGIIHRDLKPGNIMLTRSGAKLLDFGLARTQAPALTPQASALATQQKPLTEEGTILGTFQYMAPEQVEGNPADARTDIFALGAVLYEAATGQRAFEGKSRASLIAAILDHEPPPIAAIRPLAPPALDRLVRACLRKDPIDRVQTAHDLMLGLTWIRESSSTGEGVAVTARRRHQRWLAPVLIALLAMTTIAFASLYLRARQPHEQASTFSILSPAGVSNGFSVAISPDGRSVAYEAARGADQMLWLRRFDETEAHVLTGTEGAQSAFWSPDGQWIAFFARGRRLKKINISKGSVQDICDGEYGVGGAWNRDGTIVFAKRFNDGLYRVPASGGEPAQLTRLDVARHESVHAWPKFLSDDRHFVYLNRTTGEERNQIAVASLDGGAPKFLVKADSLVGFAPPHLLYVRDNVLYAHQLDERALALKGDAIEIAGNLAFDESWATSGASVSPAGVIAYYPLVSPRAEVRVYDRHGAVLRTLLADDGIGQARLSPDGRRLAVTKRDVKKGAFDIWIVDLARGVRTRITGGLSNNHSASWSPDGTRIVYLSDRAGMYDIYAQGVDDAAPPAVIWKSERDKFSPAWTPDGRSLVTGMEPAGTQSDLYVVGMDGEKPRPLIIDEFNEEDPAVSPDGRWVAFTSRRSGSDEIFVTPIGGGRITQLSTNGGAHASWSRDGSELFYLANDRTLMSVTIRVNGSSLDPAVPKPLFTLPAIRGERPFTTTPDGNFLIPAANLNETTPDHINILMGWRARRRTDHP